jgi:hypothetical protein
MEKQFKIIELEACRLLITKEFDNDDGKPIVSVTFFIENIKCTHIFECKTTEERNKLFDGLTDEEIKAIVDAAIEILK